MLNLARKLSRDKHAIISVLTHAMQELHTVDDYLSECEQQFEVKYVKATNRYTIRDALKRIFRDRHIHELRYSFITRAKECGCNPELVMKWVGHEFDADVKTSRVDRGYTTYSQEYILQEINKIDYKL